MPAIVDRLTRQLRARKVSDAKSMAIALLKKHGILNAHNKLTAKGQQRNRMTPAQRAKDRASKLSGKPTSVYAYNKHTNRATLKK